MALCCFGKEFWGEKLGFGVGFGIGFGVGVPLWGQGLSYSWGLCVVLGWDLGQNLGFRVVFMDCSGSIGSGIPTFLGIMQIFWGKLGFGDEFGIGFRIGVAL